MVCGNAEFLETLLDLVAISEFWPSSALHVVLEKAVEHDLEACPSQ